MHTWLISWSSMAAPRKAKEQSEPLGNNVGMDNYHPMSLHRNAI